MMLSINYFNGMRIKFNYAEFPVLETSRHNNEVKDDLAWNNLMLDYFRCRAYNRKYIR